VPLLIKNPPPDFHLEPESRFSLLNCKGLIDSIIQNKPLDTATDLVVAERLASAIVRKFDLDEEEVQKWNEARRCFYNKERKFVWTGLGESLEYAIQDDCSQDIVATDVKIPEVSHSPFQMAIESVNQKYGVQSDSKMYKKTKQQLSDLGYL
jgi:hypothetical protein